MVQNTKEILIWVGLVAAVSAGAAGLLGSGVISSAQTESLEITEASFKRAGTADGVLTVAVKNAGTSEIENLVVTVNQVPLTGTGNVGGFGDDAGTPGANGFTAQPSTTGTITLTATSTNHNLIFDFRDNTSPHNDNINAGQTIFYSDTVDGSSGISIGQSFTITVSGTIGTNPIVESGVVTVTGF